MTVVSLRLPVSLHETAKEIARREQISINQLLTLALAEKLSALMTEDYFEERARRADRSAFERALRKVPAEDPGALDRIREPGAVYDVASETVRPEFEAVWLRILAHAGETFRQKRGAIFSYVVDGELVRPDRTTAAISKSHFERAYRLVPLPSVTSVQRLWGPSYIYAILMDDRIRQNDW